MSEPEASASLNQITTLMGEVVGHLEAEAKAGRLQALHYPTLRIFIDHFTKTYLDQRISHVSTEAGPTYY